MEGLGGRRPASADFAVTVVVWDACAHKVLSRYSERRRCNSTIHSETLSYYIYSPPILASSDCCGRDRSPPPPRPGCRVCTLLHRQPYSFNVPTLQLTPDPLLPCACSTLLLALYSHCYRSLGTFGATPIGRLRSTARLELGQWAVCDCGKAHLSPSILCKYVNRRSRFAS